MSPAYSITSGFQIEQAASLRLRNLILYVDCLLWPVTWRLAFRSCTRGDTCTMFVSYEPPINGASECYDLSLAPVDTVLPAGLQRNAALSISSLFAELERSSRSSGPPLEFTRCLASFSRSKAGPRETRIFHAGQDHVQCQDQDLCPCSLSQ